jgi:hypothetical protein
VTSVLQTTAGKMIFGKFDDRGNASGSYRVPAELQQTKAPVPVADQRKPQPLTPVVERPAE